MTDVPSTTGGQATITRVFDAPRGEVWKYFTEPELFASWFGTPPYTTPASTVSMDVKPGGAWRATMTTTLVDAGDGKTEVTYHQVGHMPAEQYRAVEEGVSGFYDRLAEQLAR